MIVDEEKDKEGKYFRLGMIERLGLTLDNYASSDFGSRFYSEEYLKGICERRNEIHANVTRATGAVILATTVLAFFDSIEGTTKFWGLTFSLPEIGGLALCILVAVNLLAFAFAIIDQLIIDRLINVLGQRTGIFNFELILLNFSARNLWTMATTPKYFGLASQTGQKSVQAIMGLFLILLGGAFFAFPTIVVSKTLLDQDIANMSFVPIALSLATLVVFLFTFFFLGLFMLNYKFRPTGLSEPSEPSLPENFLDLGYPAKPKSDQQNDPQDS